MGAIDIYNSQQSKYKKTTFIFWIKFSRRGKIATRKALQQWQDCRNTFRPIITVPEEMSIKRLEDPPPWHLESCHSTTLIFQIVRGLSALSLKTPSFKGMSKIIQTLCREKDFLRFYQTVVLMKCNSVQHSHACKQLKLKGKKVNFFL